MEEKSKIINIEKKISDHKIYQVCHLLNKQHQI